MVRSLRSRPTETNGLKEQSSFSSLESDEYLQITPRRIWVKYKKPILVIRGLYANELPSTSLEKKLACSQENALKRKIPPTRISPRKKQRFQEHDEIATSEMESEGVRFGGQQNINSYNQELGINADAKAGSEQDNHMICAQGTNGDYGDKEKEDMAQNESSKLHSQTSMTESKPPSRIATPLPASTKPDAPLRNPNELLSEDLPPPFFPVPIEAATEPFSDAAAAILYAEYPPLPPLSAFLGPMTSHPLSSLSTTTLTALALNTHRALSAWQDAYIILDQQTAPLANPPKKPANGGRLPIEKRAWEALKEAELAAFCAPAAPPATGRGLRRRRNAEDLLGLPSSTHGILSEDDSGVGKRARKPVRRFEIGTSNGARGERQQSQASFSNLNPAAHTNGNGIPVKRGPRVAALISQDLDHRAASSTPELSTEAETSDPNDDSSSENNDEEHRRRRGGGIGRGGTKGRGGRGGRASGRGASKATTSANGVTTGAAAEGAASTTGAIDPAPHKPRVKSEKRSESMTAWWAERKRKAAEAKRAAAESAAPVSIQRAAAARDGTIAQQSEQRNQGQALAQPLNPNVQRNVVRLPYAQTVQVPLMAAVPPQQRPPPQAQHQQHPNHYQSRQPHGNTRGNPPPHPGVQIRNILQPPSTSLSAPQPQPQPPPVPLAQAPPHPPHLLPNLGQGPRPGYMNGDSSGYNSSARPRSGFGNGWAGGGGYP